MTKLNRNPPITNLYMKLIPYNFNYFYVFILQANRNDINKSKMSKAIKI